ncbi:MAG: hypothetical protein KGL42_12530 [Betaproteobacteria bacterium]|nr:hypothetical protein [Betaproteobacteria bacterium]
MTQQKIRPARLGDEAHHSVALLEILAAWSYGNDIPISDEDADWLDDQIAIGMLDREALPPDVAQRVMQIHSSIELTERIIQRL